MIARRCFRVLKDAFGGIAIGNVRGIATAVHTTIISLAGTARLFLEDPDRSRIMRRGLSLALAAIAVWFALNTAR